MKSRKFIATPLSLLDSLSKILKWISQANISIFWPLFNLISVSHLKLLLPNSMPEITQQVQSAVLLSSTRMPFLWIRFSLYSSVPYH